MFLFSSDHNDLFQIFINKMINAHTQVSLFFEPQTIYKQCDSSSLSFPAKKRAVFEELTVLRGFVLINFNIYILKVLRKMMQGLLNIPQTALQKGIGIDLTFHTIFALFQQSLKDKAINFGVNLSTAAPSRGQMSLVLFLPFNHSDMEVQCSVKGRWQEEMQLMRISISFTFCRITGRRITELGNRTRVQLLSAIGQINNYLNQKGSCLTMSSSFFDALVMSVSKDLITTCIKNRQRAVNGLLNTAVQEFVKYLGELNAVEWFCEPDKNANNSSLGQILQALYTSKPRIFVNNYKKPEATLKNCLAFLAKNVAKHNKAFRDIELSNGCDGKIGKDTKNASKEPIASAIKIRDIGEPHPCKYNKFYGNLKINKAEACEGIVSLKDVTFQLRKSFGKLRPGKKDNIIPLRYENHQPNREHLVIKRCININQREPSAPQKTKIQSGHQNQHNFLMMNGNLSSPFIGKYYVDLDDAKIERIAHRKIMTRFQEGDLLTEVAYNTCKGFKQFGLIEYLTMFEQLALAISFLHENRILHRDIKPTNILFKYRAKNRFICRLIDFGSCFVCRQESYHHFNPKIYTTPGFNLTFKEAQQQTYNEIGRSFTQHSYETHQLFDIYAIASTISYLLNNSLQRYRFQLLDQVLKICMNPNPNLRFTPQQLLTIIRHLKLTCTNNSPIPSMHRLLPCQNN